jgi:23S rRNA (cytidine1920-2'-O)/16S rRNA (cytidine1409-2'-O)-methyltransferase
MPKAEVKQRADLMLVARGLAETQSRAQSYIMAGLVFSGTSRIMKPGDLLVMDCPLRLRDKGHPFVSRGGVKLDFGLNYFKMRPQGLVALDVGASTGGFTDVLLSRGAARVYAVDVGHGQLDWRLRNDSRVIVLERVNARYLNPVLVPEPIGILSCDASFIGLRTLLPAPLSLCTAGAIAIALIKPQFEASRDAVGNDGVVRDPEIQRTLVAAIEIWWSSLPGWTVLGVTESPIIGPAGNKEFLIGARRTG